MTFSALSVSFGKENLPPSADIAPQKKKLLSSFPLKISEKENLDTIHYVLSNEIGQPELENKLKSIPTRSNGIHIGFACWMNFDLIALRNPSHAVICDIDPQMITLLDFMREKIMQSQTPQEFLDKFWSGLEEKLQSNFRGILSNEGDLDKEAFAAKVQHSGWLSTQANFLKVQEMYKKNQIIHRILNITDQNGSFENIKHWLVESGLTVDTLYISNIPEWIKMESMEKCKIMDANLAMLCDSSTVGISAWKENPMTGFPELKHEVGSIPKLPIAPPKKGPAKRLASLTLQSDNQAPKILRKFTPLDL